MRDTDVLHSAQARVLIVDPCVLAIKAEGWGMTLGYGSYPVAYGWGMDHTRWGMALRWLTKRGEERCRRSTQRPGSCAELGCLHARISRRGMGYDAGVWIIPGGVWMGYGSYPVGYGWGTDHTRWGMTLP